MTPHFPSMVHIDIPNTYTWPLTFLAWYMHFTDEYKYDFNILIIAYLRNLMIDILRTFVFFGDNQRVRVRVMVFNATGNNISVISWWSVLLVEETGVPRENHRPAVGHWQTLSHNVVSSTSCLSGIRTTLVDGGQCLVEVVEENTN